MVGSKLYKNQRKIRNRLYRKVAHHSYGRFWHRNERKAWEAKQALTEET